jgi:hypothetical protein
MKRFLNRNAARRQLRAAQGESSREAFLMRRMASKTASEDEKREFAALSSKRA